LFQQLNKELEQQILEKESKQMHHFRSMFSKLISEEEQEAALLYYSNSVKECCIKDFKLQSIVSKTGDSFNLQQQLKIKAV